MSRFFKIKKVLQGGIARKIITLLFVFGIVPLAAFTLCFFYFYYSGLKSGISNVQQEIVTRIATVISGDLEKTTGQVQLFARLLNPASQDRQTLRSLAYSLLDQGVLYDSISIADLAGTEVCKVSRFYTFRDFELAGMSRDEGFRLARQGRTHISQVDINHFSSLPQVRITVPISDSRGSVTGVLEAGVNVSRMWELISRFHIGNTRSAYIVDREGMLIAYQDISSVLEKKTLKNIESVKKLLEGAAGVSEYKGLAGDSVIGATAVIPLTGWGVVVEEPVKVAYSDLYLLSGVFLIISLFTMCCAIVLGLWFSYRGIINPLSRLEREAEAIARGGFEGRIDMQSYDEIGRLAGSFNTMVRDLKETTVSRDMLVREIAEREQAEEKLQYRLDFENVIMGISTSFINLSLDEIENGIHNAIEKIGRFADIDRSYVFNFHNDGSKMSCAYEWCADGIQPQIQTCQGLACDSLPWFMAVMKRFDAFHVPRVSELPPEASAEKEEFQKQDIQSIVCVPMIFGGVLVGFMGFDSVLTKKQWTEDIIALLRIVGEIFVNAMQRKRVEQETQKLQAQLKHAERMEAIGTLSGGIAHDFNNLLMIIEGNTSLMLLDDTDGHPHYDMLKNIEKQVQSGAKLTRQLLGYARKGRYEVRPIDINMLVSETAQTFGRTRKDITLQRELAPDLCVIEADQGQIEQVLLNLYINAADAMPDGGTILLRTMHISHEAMTGSMYAPKPGNYILLTVADTGTGMDKETMEHVFEPFFTTKELGRGTGLGLASVYGIVKSHGGYIDVDSVKGRGTTFSMYLPTSEKKVDNIADREDHLIKGQETILLVDDEPMVLDASALMLSRMGYTVFKAESGRAALQCYAEHQGSISLTILDMIMPGIGGKETFQRIREINSRAKVLLSSGYSAEGQAEELLQIGCDGFIGKPFSMKALSQKIRAILEGK